MNEQLLKQYKLLAVTYGLDTGLVSLVTGDLLACSTAGSLSTPSSVPCCIFPDWEAESHFGEEHSWSDVIRHLQQHYDWENKYLPEGEVETYEIRRFFTDQRPYEVVRRGLTLKEAQEHCEDPGTEVTGVSFDGFAKE